MSDWNTREENFHKYHGEQVINRNHNDVFFIWMTILFISVLAANLFVGLAPINSVGMIVGEDSTSNGFSLLGSLFLVFVNIFIIGVIYSKVTKKDY